MQGDWWVQELKRDYIQEDRIKLQGDQKKHDYARRSEETDYV